ncbi:MAG TPA: hypothetical protein VKS44_12390 [Candidatus Acidoferrales bacterium]|nr:hypothetical protein [Candidatus Acidoferrales bacterium]
MSRSLACAVASLLACSAVFAQSGSAPPSGSAGPASAMPHDSHAGLTISVDPYADSHRAKEKFGKSANPVPVGILPVDVFFKNDTPHPIKIDLETVQLEVHFGSGRHQDLDWMSIGEVANLIRHPGGGPSAPSARRFPVGIPLPGKDKKLDGIIAQLRPFTLDSDVIPPLGAVHGFLFFNVNHDLAAATTSSLYVPDVALLPEKTPLMFFEVPLTRKSP